MVEKYLKLLYNRFILYKFQFIFNSRPKFRNYSLATDSVAIKTINEQIKNKQINKKNYHPLRSGALEVFRRFGGTYCPQILGKKCRTNVQIAVRFYETSVNLYRAALPHTPDDK